MSACQITEIHCESCGNTSPEDVRARSYSGCCNEGVIDPRFSTCADHHGFEKRARLVEERQGSCACGATDWLAEEELPGGIWILRCDSCYAGKTVRVAA